MDSTRGSRQILWVGGAAMTSGLFTACMRGLRRRDNQDSVLARSEAGTLVLAVADGMGGHPAGDVASGLTIRAFEDECGSADPARYLERCAGRAFELVRGYGDAHPEARGLGSTLVAAVVRDDLAWIAHVGDSRAYVAHTAAGQWQGFMRVTTDHTPGEANEFAPGGPRSHALSRYIGDSAGGCEMTGPLPLPPEAVLLLMTDGVHRSLDRKALTALTANHRGLELVSAVVGAVYEVGAPDNLGLAIVDRRERSGS